MREVDTSAEAIRQRFNQGRGLPWDVGQLFRHYDTDTALLKACRAAFSAEGVTPEAAHEAIMNIMPRLNEQLEVK